MIRRIQMLVQRRKQAKTFGIQYSRGAQWEFPEQVSIGGQSLPLVAKTDNGTKTALINVFLDDCYQLGKLHNLRTILDIGGHSGFFSMAAKHYFPQANIHAYEPNPAMSKIITANLSPWENVQYFGEAVGLEAGFVHITDDDDSVLTQVTQTDSGQVPMIPIREAIERIAPGDVRLGLLKMDCEGAEWDILKDIDALEKVNYITMEYHLYGGKTLPEMVSLLDDAGFRIILEQEDSTDSGLILAERK